jgi:hypothetical protein
VHDDVGVGNLNPAGADRLDLPAFERQSRLEALLDELVVKGLAVLDDGHGRGPRRGRILAVQQAIP